MQRHPDTLPDVRRIAVLKAGGLGDVIFALPALEALRAAYPHAELTLLTSALGEELLRDRPAPVDGIVRVPPFEGDAADGAAVDALCERFSAEGIDLAVQVHGGGANSNPLVRRLGARTTVGLRAPDAPALDREVPYRYFQPEVLRCLEVATLAGAPPVSLEPRIAVTPADLTAADALLPPDGRPLAVLHPGAGDGRRRWPASAFGEVAQALSAEGARVAIVGTADARMLAAEIAAAVPRAWDLTGRTRLDALAGVLARASVVVSNDSGPLHLASAVGAPTVGIYWCGNLVNAGPATVRRHRALASWRLDCPVCGVDCMTSSCTHDASFVADVPVAQVAGEALSLLRAPRDEHASEPGYHL